MTLIDEVLLHLYLALILAQILFGLNFVASKYIVHRIDPGHYVFYRFFITTIIVWLFAPLFWANRPRLTLKFMGLAFLFAALGYVGTQFFIVYGLSLTSPSNAAIITTLIPLFTLMIIVVSGQQRLTFFKGLGFFLAFLGVCLTQDWENFKLSSDSVQGDLIVLLGAISAAVFLSYSRTFYAQADAYWSAAILFLCSTIICVPAVWMLEWPDNFQWDSPFLWSFGYAIIFGTLGAYLLINSLIPKLGAEKVSLFTYLQPIVAAFGGLIFLDAGVEIKLLVASVIIFLGFYLAMRSSKLER